MGNFSLFLILILTGAIFFGGIFIFLWLLSRKIKELTKNRISEEDKAFLMIQQQISQLREVIDQKDKEKIKVLDEKLNQIFDISRGQFKESQEILNKVSLQSQNLIRNVTERLTKLDETNRQVVEFSSQLKNLQDILKNPKQRGVLGEYYLEETLKNVLPPNSYQMQYSFKDGTIVDAVIFVKEKIIPVDSKFSLEKYEQLINCGGNKELRKKLELEFSRDLRNRIDETAKYVKTSEGTVDFAFMFIPSESIYYDLLVNKFRISLIEYAFQKKHVIIVSPTSFLAYLQTVLQGLRMLQIEESAKEIRNNIEKLAKHLVAYENSFEKMGNSLAITVNHFNQAGKEWKKIDKDLMKISQKKEPFLKPMEELNKPQIKED